MLLTLLKLADGKLGLAFAELTDLKLKLSQATKRLEDNERKGLGLGGGLGGIDTTVSNNKNSSSSSSIAIAAARTVKTLSDSFLRLKLRTARGVEDIYSLAFNRFVLKRLCGCLCTAQPENFKLKDL